MSTNQLLVTSSHYRAARWLSKALIACLLPIAAYGADPQNGQKVYANYCASCHGTDGVGVVPLAPNFKRGESLLKPDAALAKSIKNGKGSMPGYTGILKDRDVFDVIAHMRMLMQ